MRLADGLLFTDPIKALKVLDQIVELTEEPGLQNRALRAAAFHARANRLAQVNKHTQALDDARQAIALLRDLIGPEEQLISAFCLAALQAEILGHVDEAEAYRNEADNLTEKTASSRFGLARRIEELGRVFDDDVAAMILQDAQLAGDAEIVAGVRIIKAVRDPKLTDAERLSSLEETLYELDHANVREAAKQPARLALAGQLLRLNHPQRAATWFQLVLTSDPFQAYARDGLIQCLWLQKRWGDAASVLKRQIDLLGQLPGLLYAYGNSLLEEGNYSEAVGALTKAMQAAVGNVDLEKRAQELREKAFRLGGTISPPAPQIVPLAVTLEEFDETLEAFARLISSEKRMSFWKKVKGSDYAWIERPEKLAQDFLHTFLRARLQERVSIFEELATGAGRLDIYVQLHGGLSFILELKLCGFGYSSAYAAAGEGQILHYMQNRRSHLGYLVVFDARLDSFGQPVLKSTGADTVINKLIDLRPRVSGR
jgi:tetratricopeptide (TPR) repeat protein